jgi:hypothetical protein
MDLTDEKRDAIRKHFERLAEEDLPEVKYIFIF